MFSKIRKSYEHTIYASYIGYITQAIVNNFVPLLFLTFASDFDLGLDQITLITTVNFAVQLTVDLVCTKLVDKIGYRKMIMFAHACCSAGLFGLAVLPSLLGNAYVGIMASVVLYAIGGGIIEVLISPIVEACPTKKKEAAMSLLHSFYCWGHVGVVLLSTAFFSLFGIDNWALLAVVWALVPLANCFYFALVPIYEIQSEGEHFSLGGVLKNKLFWLFVIIMICAGASEQAMSQWASAFAESALNVSKTVGDLAGPCAFAVLMGTSRALYGKFSDKLPLKPAMMLSAVLCVVCYLIASLSPNPVLGFVGCAVCGFSVGIFWPGTFSLAPKYLPSATGIYALLALAGDVGCSSGPTVVGLVADGFDGNLKLGILVAIAFPVIIFFAISLLKSKQKNNS